MRVRGVKKKEICVEGIIDYEGLHGASIELPESGGQRNSCPRVDLLQGKKNFWRQPFRGSVRQREVGGAASCRGG